MRMQYLHLSVYPCEKCQGPVVAGSLGIRETEVTREIDIRNIGAVCLYCGNRQSTVTAPLREFVPAQWNLAFRGTPETSPG
jgi:hypothetical protein